MKRFDKLGRDEHFRFEANGTLCSADGKGGYFEPEGRHWCPPGFVDGGRMVVPERIADTEASE